MSESISNIIKGIRTLRELSQQKMAKDLSVSVNYISLIENKKKKPGVIFLKKFSTRYHIPMLLLTKETIIPKAKTPKEKKIQKKVIGIINDLEKIFLQA